jgi:hypothetical protein
MERGRKKEQKRRSAQRNREKFRDKAWRRYIRKKFGCELDPAVMEMLLVVREWRARFGGAGRRRLPNKSREDLNAERRMMRAGSAPC